MEHALLKRGRSQHTAEHPCCIHGIQCPYLPELCVTASPPLMLIWDHLSRPEPLYLPLSVPSVEMRCCTAALTENSRVLESRADISPLLHSTLSSMAGCQADGASRGLFQKSATFNRCAYCWCFHASARWFPIHILIPGNILVVGKSSNTPAIAHSEHLSKSWDHTCQLVCTKGKSANADAVRLASNTDTGLSSRLYTAMCPERSNVYTLQTLEAKEEEEEEEEDDDFGDAIPMGLNTSIGATASLVDLPEHGITLCQLDPLFVQLQSISSLRCVAHDAALTPTGFLAQGVAGVVRMGCPESCDVHLVASETPGRGIQSVNIAFEAGSVLASLNGPQISTHVASFGLPSVAKSSPRRLERLLKSPEYESAFFQYFDEHMSVIRRVVCLLNSRQRLVLGLDVQHLHQARKGKHSALSQGVVLEGSRDFVILASVIDRISLGLSSDAAEQQHLWNHLQKLKKLEQREDYAWSVDRIVSDAKASVRVLVQEAIAVANRDHSAAGKAGGSPTEGNSRTTGAAHGPGKAPVGMGMDSAPDGVHQWIADHQLACLKGCTLAHDMKHKTSKLSGVLKVHIREAALATYLESYLLYFTWCVGECDGSGEHLFHLWTSHGSTVRPPAASELREGACGLGKFSAAVTAFLSRKEADLYSTGSENGMNERFNSMAVSQLPKSRHPQFRYYRHAVMVTVLRWNTIRLLRVLADPVARAKLDAAILAEIARVCGESEICLGMELCASFDVVLYVYMSI